MRVCESLRTSFGDVATLWGAWDHRGRKKFARAGPRIYSLLTWQSACSYEFCVFRRLCVADTLVSGAIMWKPCGTKQPSAVGELTASVARLGMSMQKSPEEAVLVADGFRSSKLRWALSAWLDCSSILAHWTTRPSKIKVKWTRP